jgi:Rhodopirellula transposase DDE domain
LAEAVEEQVADRTAGSPVAPEIRWTSRSPREIAEELAEQGYVACRDTVRRILTHLLGLRRRQAVKNEAGSEFPWRDEQFQHIAARRAWYERRGWPVVSIDTKKKELLGEFFRPGRAYTDGVVRVLDHDFLPPGQRRLIPYGVYDVAANEGFLFLATGADTSELACDAVWRWWQRLGRRRYWHASGLLVLCDCGGSNGHRHYRFKEALHHLACDLRRDIEVAHYPPGCSKYNPIEHRLFCHVSRAWQSAILRTIEIARDLAARVHTSTGLRLIPEIANHIYEKGCQVSRDFRDHMPINFPDLLPELNYTAPAWG